MNAEQVEAAFCEWIRGIAKLSMPCPPGATAPLDQAFLDGFATAVLDGPPTAGWFVPLVDLATEGMSPAELRRVVVAVLVAAATLPDACVEESE